MRYTNFIILFILYTLIPSLYPNYAYSEEKSGFLENTSIDVKLSYSSKYISKGYDLWDDSPAFQPDIFVDLGGTGLYAGIWSSYSVEGGCRDPFGDRCSKWNENDYYAGYYNSIGEGSLFLSKYDVSYTYYRFFKLSGVDINEAALSVTHPNILPEIGPSRPAFYWTYYYAWPGNSNGKDARYIKVGINETFPIKDVKVTPHIEAMWDDGAGGFDTGNGWSYARVGLCGETSWNNIRLEPSIYYQKAIKDADPDDLLEDEFWFKLTFAYNLKPF